jgi:predicted permease
MNGASYYAIKVIVSALLIVAISELSKRSTMAGSLLASLPILSVLAMVWLYADTRDAAQVAALSRSVFWLVLPSLVLFLLLPALLDRGYEFFTSLALSIGATILVYFAAIALSRQLGLKL